MTSSEFIKALAAGAKIGHSSWSGYIQFKDDKIVDETGKVFDIEYLLKGNNLSGFRGLDLMNDRAMFTALVEGKKVRPLDWPKGEYIQLLDNLVDETGTEVCLDEFPRGLFEIYEAV